MAAGKWEQVKDLFVKALDQPSEERQAFLNRACIDASVRLEIERLLREHEAASNFIHVPLVTCNDTR